MNEKPKRLPLRDLTAPRAWDWSCTLRVLDDGSAVDPGEPAIVASALLNILDEARVARRDLDGIARHLAAIRRLLEKPAQPPAPRKPTLAEREAASRARAWSAYLKASGGQASGGQASGNGRCGGRIDELDPRPSVRVTKGFRRNGIETVWQLTELTAGELMRWPNFGAASLLEVREILKRFGLSLKGD